MILEEFATPFHGLPRSCCAPEDQDPGDQKPRAVQDTLREKVHSGSDAAASVLLSGEMLRGRRVEAKSGAATADFPNVRVVGRDAAHASTRLLRRPLCHHDVLKTVVAEFVTGCDSFAQKVFHSNIFSGWRRTALAREEDDSESEFRTGNSMAAAKHRFGSYALPMGRICRNVAAMLAVLHRVDAMRGDKSGWASQTLKHLTGKKLLLLAMAADAAHCCLDFTRFADQEGVDIACLNAKVAQLGRSVRALFVNGEVLRLPTFTMDMLAILEKGELTVMADGCARELAVTEHDKQYALKVMCEWVETVEAAVEAEFPSWHLISCFAVFNLEARRAEDQEDKDSVKKCLQKLSQAFKVKPALLEQQYVSLLPLAEALHKEGYFQNRAAWVEAFARVQQRRAAQRQDCEALLPVLSAYLAWSASTSGVEQLFSKLKRSPVELASASADTDNRLAVVLGSQTCGAADDDKLIRDAQAIYTGMLRSRKARGGARRKRLDWGLKRRTMEDRKDSRGKKSEAAWHRRRKAGVAKAAGNVTATPPRRPAPELPSSSAKEVDHQRQVARKRKAEALLDGYLVGDEITGDVRSAANDAAAGQRGQ